MSKEYYTYLKLKRICFLVLFNLVFMLPLQHLKAQNNVSSAGELAIFSSLDLATSSIWTTDRVAIPGYFSWVSGSTLYTGQDDSHNINGYVKKYGSDAFIFPVGTGLDLRSLSMSSPTSASDSYATAWILGDPSVTGDPTNGNAMHATTSFTGSIVAVSKTGQWDWVPISGSGVGLTITVSIPAISETGLTVASDLRLVGWNGSSWVNLGTAGASGLAENSTLSGTMIAGIQSIGIGAVNTAVIENPSLNLVKTAVFDDQNQDGFAEAGESITYSFTIKNTGNVPLTGVVVSDALPGLVLTGSSIPVLGSGFIDNTTYKGVYILTQTDVNLGKVTNQASVTGKSPNGTMVIDLSNDSEGLGDKPTVLPISGCVIEAFKGMSPNGDGLNDVFYIRGLECYPDNSVEIYNRFGILVFNAEHYNNVDNAFTGVSKGKGTISESQGLPVGTYYYIFKYKDNDGNGYQKAGYLYINR